MKITKKALALLLALVMLIGMLPTVVLAEEAPTGGTTEGLVTSQSVSMNNDGTGTLTVEAYAKGKGVTAGTDYIFVMDTGSNAKDSLDTFDLSSDTNDQGFESIIQDVAYNCLERCGESSNAARANANVPLYYMLYNRETGMPEYFPLQSAYFDTNPDKNSGTFYYYLFFDTEENGKISHHYLHNATEKTETKQFLFNTYTPLDGSSKYDIVFSMKDGSNYSTSYISTSNGTEKLTLVENDGNTYYNLDKQPVDADGSLISTSSQNYSSSSTKSDTSPTKPYRKTVYYGPIFDKLENGSRVTEVGAEKIAIGNTLNEIWQNEQNTVSLIKYGNTSTVESDEKTDYYSYNSSNNLYSNVKILAKGNRSALNEDRIFGKLAADTFHNPLATGYNNSDGSSNRLNLGLSRAKDIAASSPRSSANKRLVVISFIAQAVTNTTHKKEITDQVNTIKSLAGQDAPYNEVSLYSIGLNIDNSSNNSSYLQSVSSYTSTVQGKTLNNATVPYAQNITSYSELLTHLNNIVAAETAASPATYVAENPELTTSAQVSVSLDTDYFTVDTENIVYSTQECTGNGTWGDKETVAGVSGTNLTFSGFNFNGDNDENFVYVDNNGDGHGKKLVIDIPIRYTGLLSEETLADYHGEASISVNLTSDGLVKAELPVACKIHHSEAGVLPLLASDVTYLRTKPVDLTRPIPITYKNNAGEEVTHYRNVAMETIVNDSSEAKLPYLYGGIYSDTNYTTPITDVSVKSYSLTGATDIYVKDVSREYAYPFYLRITKDGVTSQLYFISTADSTNYTQVGFLEDGTTKLQDPGKEDCVYNNFVVWKNGSKAFDQGFSYFTRNYTGRAAGVAESGYVTAYRVDPEKVDFSNFSITYQPFYVTMDSIQVASPDTCTVTAQVEAASQTTLYAESFIGSSCEVNSANGSFEINVGDGDEHIYEIEIGSLTAEEQTVLASDQINAASSSFSSSRGYSEGDNTIAIEQTYTEPLTVLETNNDEKPQPPEPTTITVTKMIDGKAVEEKLEPGDLSGLIAAPEKSGCLFAGWYLDEGFKTPADFSDVEEDLVIYARFVKASDMVPTVATLNLLSKTYSVSLTLGKNDFEEIGFLYNTGKAEGVVTMKKSSLLSLVALRSGKAVYSGSFSAKNLANGGKVEISLYWITADGTTVTAPAVSYTNRYGTLIKSK